MRKLNAILLVLALGVLVYFVHQVGLARVLGGFAQVGWGFVPLMGIFVSAFLLETWCWGRCFRQVRGVGSLLLPSWCGQSINQLTPGSSLGEVVKGGLLAGVASSEAIVSSLILYNLSYIYGTVIVVLVGSVGFWMLAYPPLPLKLAGSAVGVASLAGVFLFHRGLLREVVSGLLRRLARWRGSQRLYAAADHMQSWEREMRLMRSEHPWRFRQVVTVMLLAHAMHILELWAIWYQLGVQLDLARVFVFAVVDTLVQVVFIFVPGKLGVAEGTSYYVAGLLDLDRATGLNEKLVGRCVRLVFSIGGALALAVLTIRKPADRETPAA